jgi:hypothetical protein
MITRVEIEKTKITKTAKPKKAHILPVDERTGGCSETIGVGD